MVTQRMSGIEELFVKAPNRNFNEAELGIIRKHKDFNKAISDGWCFLEDDRLESQLGDKVECVLGLYIITWADDLAEEYGDFIAFNQLRAALDLFFNHK